MGWTVSATVRALGMKYGPFRNLSGDKLKTYMAERHAIESEYPIPRATIDDVMAHLLHALAKRLLLRLRAERAALPGRLGENALPGVTVPSG